MDGEQTSVPAPEQASAEQPVQTSPTPQAQPEVTPAPTGQPAQRVNLHDLPEFREYQRQQAARERQRQQAEAQLQARLRELETRDMTDDQRLAYEVQERDRYIENLHRQIQERDEREQLSQQRWNDISWAADLSGVPVSALLQAQDRADAVRLAKEYQTRQTRQSSQQQRSDAMRVDLGTGTASTNGSALQQQYDAAMKNYDSGKAMDIMLQAEAEGVDLKL